MISDQGEVALRIEVDSNGTPKVEAYCLPVNELFTLAEAAEAFTLATEPCALDEESAAKIEAFVNIAENQEKQMVRSVWVENVDRSSKPAFRFADPKPSDSRSMAVGGAIKRANEQESCFYMPTNEKIVRLPRTVTKDDRSDEVIMDEADTLQRVLSCVVAQIWDHFGTTYKLDLKELIPYLLLI